MIHPLKRANFIKFRDKAQGPLPSRYDPVCGWSSQWIPCTLKPHAPKGKRPHLKSWTCLDHSWCTCYEMSVKLSSSGEKRKGNVDAAVRLHMRTERWCQVQRHVVKRFDRQEKWWSQIQRPVVQHFDRLGENLKKASCCTLLKRITKLRCVNSEVKSNVGSTT